MNRLMLFMPIFFLVAIQDTLTGLFGAPSIVATMLASRAMGYRSAITLSTLAQLIGPFLFGVAVATTLGSDIVEIVGLSPTVMDAALGSTVLWMLFSWYLRIPSSSTHALVGGLVGAVFTAVGPTAIHLNGLFKILLTLTLTAPLGIVAGYIVVRLCYWLAQNASPKINARFNQGQFLASIFLGLAIGSSNAQNAMGVTVLGLMTTGLLTQFEVPLWVIIMSAIFLALGNLIGGMRVMRSIGGQFYRIQPIHGFSAQVASAAIIAINSLLGGEVSTTHVTSMSIIGAGAAERLSMVRWGFVQRVLVTWVLTIPVTAILAGLLYVLFASF